MYKLHTGSEGTLNEWVLLITLEILIPSYQLRLIISVRVTEWKQFWASKPQWGWGELLSLFERTQTTQFYHWNLWKKVVNGVCMVIIEIEARASATSQIAVLHIMMMIMIKRGRLILSQGGNLRGTSNAQEILWRLKVILWNLSRLGFFSLRFLGVVAPKVNWCNRCVVGLERIII